MEVEEEAEFVFHPVMDLIIGVVEVEFMVETEEMREVHITLQLIQIQQKQEIMV